MKKNLLKSMLVVGMLALGMNVQADIPVGNVYFKNISTGKFLAGGHSWGTRAIVNEVGLDFTVTAGEGVYTLDSRVANNSTDHFLGDNLFIDAGSFGWTITEASDYVTISNSKGYLVVDANDEIVQVTDVTDAAKWKMIPAETEEATRLEALKAALSAATASSPVNATGLIKCPQFNRNDTRNDVAWSMEAGNKNLKGGGDNGNGCAESYHSTFTLSQVLANAPKGIYKMTAQGFYRQDGSDNDNLPVFYANDKTMVFPLRTGSENSMAAAGASFMEGKYEIEPIFVEVTADGELTIGAKLEVNTTLWCIWDNFQLTYFGADATIDQVMNAAILDELQNLRAKAQELLPKVAIESVKAELQEALNSTEDVSGADEINAAIALLKEAVNKAEAYIEAETKFANMKELIEKTNFYTEQALEEYYTKWYEKYQAGTLTSEEAKALQDPNVLTGWHDPITCDNFLLSVWDTNPDFNEAPYYINTWSVEGDNDGTGFHVPFFEYWTADANVLAARTLTGTLEKIPEGIYDVKAWVRVRTSNGKGDPTGITMQVGDGDPINVSAGQQVGTSQFYLNEFVAQGKVTEDGVLKVKFIVAEDNTISWLSFKNVWYELNDVATAIQTVNSDAKHSDAIFNLNGQQVEKAVKGLYIMNGKKVLVK